jgi:hypothetical protein
MAQDDEDTVLEPASLDGPDLFCCAQELDEPIPDLELWAVEKELGIALPESYRAFIRRFGSGRVRDYDLFGVPRNHLWGDIVLMNALAAPTLPPAYVIFSQDYRGWDYCFDTSRRDAEGECPVVVFRTAVRATVARNFVEFLLTAILGGS